MKNKPRNPIAALGNKNKGGPMKNKKDKRVNGSNQQSELLSEQQSNIELVDLEKASERLLSNIKDSIKNQDIVTALNDAQDLVKLLSCYY